MTERISSSRMEEIQEKLLPFLLDPKSYAHGPRGVRMIQTHSSFVFLVPPFVYKVKKAVDFGFLDYSTLAKRHHFCKREVELNRRLCPHVYLGVVPIVRTGNHFSFGEKGEIVEYAVKMRKLSSRYFLDHLLERGTVSLLDMNRIIRVLKIFYEAQNPTPEVEARGRIDRLKISTDENFKQTEGFVGQTISQGAFEGIRFFTEAFYRIHAPLFESRIQGRWIRDCHGDLHSEHIHITPRAVQIYDCIEFNDRFRYQDVASDIAFLAMDLDHHNRSDLARYLVKGMAAALRDEAMPSLMNFYKCYRAYVRGKVESLHSMAHAAPEAERLASADAARRYFRLALQYAIAGSEPLVLVVMGHIGSGKSTLAKALSEELGWPVFSSDRVRKKMAGVPLFKRGSNKELSRLYSPGMTKKTYDTMLTLAIDQVQQGQSVILDATFGRPLHRKRLSRLFAERKIRFRVIEAQADRREVKKRLEQRAGAFNEISDARLENFQMLMTAYEPPREWNQSVLFEVKTTKSIERTVSSAFKKLAEAEVESLPPR